LTQSLEYNFYHLSKENNFSSRFVFFTHLCSFEWKSSYIYIYIYIWNHMNGTFNMELKWYNQLIFNIWLGISSKLTIIWYFWNTVTQVAIHCYEYYIFTNMFFNPLISTKCNLFQQFYSLDFELPYYEYNLWKKNHIDS